MRYKILFLLFTILYCEFIDGALEGPPSKEKDDDDNEESTEEFIASIKDEDGSSALKIVSAPDLSKEHEKNRGMVNQF